MKFTLTILDQAEREIQTEFDWYEDRSPGLGERLLTSIDESFDLIIDYPNSFPVRRKNYQQCLVRGFPYIIVYKIAGNQIIVHQLFHVKRRPGRKVK